jgi:hypothetical protein
MIVRSLATLIRPHKSGLHSAVIVFAYVAIYVALDRVSFFQVLPGTCFTPWNPPPAASLALLVIYGLRFAPWLFVAGVISDAVIVGCPVGIPATIATNAIVAMGYTGVAAALRHFTHADQGSRELLISCICCSLPAPGPSQWPGWRYSHL